MKVGQHVFATDGYDLGKARLRVVIEVFQDGCAARTVESEHSILFRTDHLRPATDMEVRMYRHIVIPKAELNEIEPDETEPEEPDEK